MPNSDIKKILAEEPAVKVLIIDDLADNRTLLRLDLEDEIAHVEVHEAENGERGLELMNQINFSLVICDLMMPGIDGFEVYRRATEMFDEWLLPPFIFLSANKQKEVAERGLEIGAIDYMTKPYDLMELIYKVKNLSRIKILADTLKNSREKLVDANDRLKELNREKDEMLRIVSHDMRNPLNNIIGLANLLSEDEHDTEDTSEIGSIIERNSQSMLDMVNSLLDVARIESGKLKIQRAEQQVNQIIRDVIKGFISSAAQKKIQLSMSSDSEEIIYMLDKAKFEQMLGNLISNGLKFTDEGGSVKVHSEARSVEGFRYPELRIHVSDNGIGIPDNKIDSIFDKFSEFHRKGTRNEKGSGLGLSIVNYLVELHDGYIEVNSEVEGGTEFVINLPPRGERDKGEASEKT